MQANERQSGIAKPLHPVVVSLLFLLFYVGLDGISYWHPIAPVAITPWNPPPGLSICLLLLFGMRYTGLLLLAALLAEWWVRDLPASLPVLLLASATLAGGYAVTAHVLARLLPERQLLTSLQLTRFVSVVALASLLIGCTFVAVFHVAGVLSTEQIGEAVLQFWVGDVIGILVVVPLILSYWQREERSHWALPDRLWLLILLALLWYVFALESTDEFRHFYLLFVPLIALALRQGLAGATVAVALTQVALIVLMRPRDPSAETIRGLQLLLMAYAVTGLYLGVAISERRRTQQLLLQQQLALSRANRMAAVSELASALAHELNQPLSAIALYVRACQRMLADAASVTEVDAVMNRIGAEVQRAGAVVHRLREFFRSGGLTLTSQSVNDLITRVVAAERPRCQSLSIGLELELAADVPNLLVDAIHLQTVIDNLLRNALDALSGRSGGVLRVTSRYEHGMVDIVVEDNAGGVPELLRPHLFETLTTSKPEGLGLGLAISRQLIEAHGGQLRYEALAQGSRFRISLPATPAV
ncbi:hypothetical protein HPT27_17140 [Permianibacter sp. IMCC34836]|uniref:MASE1 domain-containing protein n=1 Tax=Permianibacter fluminis TaxID=2738515 RepID=UPI001551D354|nr:MASE1 domain-containing protein [Permianibacter fluminis]NQD38745.1 hypothetical protein [Permianibacter fluminis]